MSRYPPARHFWDPLANSDKFTYDPGSIVQVRNPAAFRFVWDKWTVKPINERALDAAVRRFPALCRAWRLEEEWLPITRAHIEELMGRIRTAYREELANAAD